MCHDSVSVWASGALFEPESVTIVATPKPLFLYTGVRFLTSSGHMDLAIYHKREKGFS